MSNMKKGFGLIEIIIGVTIISLSLFGLMAVARITNQLVSENSRVTKAGFLLEEGIEAVKILRDVGWQDNIASLSLATDYYLEFSNSNWKATSSNIYIDEVFERKFRLEDVYRDVDDNISSSGVLDPDTKKLIVYVSWLERKGTTTKNISTYLTNLFNN